MLLRWAGVLTALLSSVEVGLSADFNWKKDNIALTLGGGIKTGDPYYNECAVGIQPAPRGFEPRFAQYWFASSPDSSIFRRRF